MGAPRPTLAKVAALAGVSISQASDALRGGGRVSRATRQRVRDAATTLGYQTQAVAKVLREGKAGFVAIVADRQTTNAPDGSIYPFWSKAITSFTVTMQDAGYSVILEFDPCADRLRQLPAQVVMTMTTDADRLADVRGGGFGRVIALSPDADPASMVDPDASVVLYRHDYGAIGAAMADFLVARGSRGIAISQRPGTHWYARQIEAALRAALHPHPAVRVVSDRPRADAGHHLAAVRALLTDPAVDTLVDFGGAPAVLRGVLAAGDRVLMPRISADSPPSALQVLTQAEAGAVGEDPRLHRLSFQGADAGRLMAEHLLSVLTDGPAPDPDLPFAIVPADPAAFG